LNPEQRLIDDILDVSKLSKGLIQVELATADLHDIIKPVIELFKPVADLKNVNLHFVTSIPEPFFIETDKVRLAQIILNFVANAIKFTDAGEIKIAAELMESNLSESPTDDVRLIRIAVEDSGIGLKPGDKDRLFRLFEQGSDQKRGGTGLGLAIAKELTSLLGGTITAKSYVVSFPPLL
jgi:signal transduction histidine kinase